MRSAKDADARSMGNQTRADWAEGKASRRVEVARRALASKRAELDNKPFEVEHGRDDLWLRHEPAPKRTLLRFTTNELRAGTRPVLGPLALTVERGQHIRIAGPNGAGKTTLLNALARTHSLPPERVWHARQDVDPRVEGLDALATLARQPPDLRGATLARVGALGLDPEHLLTTKLPSPGETLKLRLALAMATQAWLLLLDEPTNHLDLPSIERLQQALTLYPGTLILITHDDPFARACTTIMWRLDASPIRGVPSSLIVEDHDQ
jgi:ATPase subunit of ABC transporter with duplicated ATPase domains